MKHQYLVKLWLLLFFAGFGLCSSAYAQTGSVSGRVLDEQGTGIPGATVIVEGTSLGNSANVEGAYSIQNVPAGPHTVVISYVGYNTTRVPVTVTAGQNTDIGSSALSENATQLAEAVVIGYGTQRRQDVTGAVTTVDSRQFVQGQVTNPEQLIQGKVAGVSITTAGGAPGAASTVRIRGNSSLNANSDPLYVIDGVPVDKDGIAAASNPLTLINPNDIETFTVLKDASATAIYGNRAAGGVILITTKHGTVGEKLHVELNSQTSFSTVARRYDVLSADQFRETIQANGLASQAAALGTANTNWQSEIFRTAGTYDNTVSLRGAAGKVPFRVSYGNLNQQGIVITNKLIRNSGSVSLTPRLLDDHLRVDVNAKGTWLDNRFADYGQIANAAFFDPTQPVTADGAQYGAYGGYFQYLTATGTPLGLAPGNPVAALNNRRDISTVKRLVGNVQLDYRVHGIEGLRANLNLGLDVSRSRGSVSVDPSDFGTYNTTSRDPGLNGSYVPSSQDKDMHLLEAYLAYDRQFGDTKFTFQAGHAYQTFQNEGLNFLTTRSDRSTLFTPGQILTVPAYYNKYVLLSFFGRSTLNIKDRYLATATVRNDQTSRFRPGSRSGWFPALGLAWRIKGEDFLKNSSTISELKLRAGYGRTGQQDIGGPYDAIARYSIGSSTSQYTGVTAAALGYNPVLSWENTNTFNAGLDLGFLADRVTVTLDVYQRTATDLLANVAVPVGSNTNNQLNRNIGSLRNRGIELAINYTPIRTNDVTWTLNANGAYNVNKITDLGPQLESFIGYRLGDPGVGTGNNIQINSVGYSSNSYYVRKQVYDSNGKPIEGLYADNGAYYRYKQVAPLVTLGFTSNVTYKKVNLGFTLRSFLGNYVYNSTAAANANFSNANTSLGFVSNLPADVLNTRFTTNTPFDSDYYVQNASFLRCENIIAGYNVGHIFGETTLRLSASVQNVFLITKYAGVDPEVPGGIDRNFYPRTRTYTFGLALGI